MSEYKPEKDNPGLEKAPTGIEGFDSITLGGLPLNRTTMISGSTGTGKTVFALQTLANGARRGEPGIFVAFEETSGQIKDNAESFGWGLRELERDGKLFFLDARLYPDTIQSGTFELAGMLAALQAKASEMGAKFIVFDAIDVLLSIMNDPIHIMKEIYALHDWLMKSGLIGIVTVRLNHINNPLSENFSVIRFIADCIITLTHTLVDQVLVRGVSIEKYRGSSYREGEYPIVIGPRGMEVVTPLLEKTTGASFEGSVSTGVKRLDEMLSGGFMRGTSILIEGGPGTAKTTLASAFAEAACRRGEKTVYVTLDQRSDILVQDMASVNIHLKPHIESGLLTIEQYYSSNQSREQFLVMVWNLVRRHAPACMVIDPISAISRSKGRLADVDLASQLVFLTVSRGITLVLTSLMDEREISMETPAIPIATVVDTLIQVSFHPASGERNRTLSIVKSRGKGHSNQMRELILSDRGITLSDVYTEEGEVLMGTLRWQKERETWRNRENARRDFEERLRQHQHAQARTLSRIKELEEEMDWQREAEKELKALQQEQEQRFVELGEKLRSMRGLEEEDRHG